MLYNKNHMGQSNHNIGYQKAEARMKQYHWENTVETVRTYVLTSPALHK